MSTAQAEREVWKLYDRVVAKARDDAIFRESLLAHPREAIERELNMKLPEDFSIRVEKGPSGNLVFVASA